LKALTSPEKEESAFLFAIMKNIATKAQRKGMNNKPLSKPE